MMQRILNPKGAEVFAEERKGILRRAAALAIAPPSVSILAPREEFSGARTALSACCCCACGDSRTWLSALLWKPGLTACFLVITSLAARSSEPAESRNTDGLTVFEQFKQFIADPPPIEDMVFSYQGPPVSRFDPATKQVFKEPAPVQHIRAQWGPEHVLVVTSPMPESLIPEPLSEQFELKEGTLLIRSKDEFWNFFSPNHVAYWKGAPAYPYERGNSVLGAYLQRTSPLFAFLNMGPHFMGPRAVQWSGNRFRYEAKVIHGEFLIEGELFAGSDGSPEKMTFRIRSATADGRYLVRYYFPTNVTSLPRFVPERVHSIVYHGAKEYPDKDIRIATLKFGMPALPAREQAVAYWIRQRPFSEFIYTNQALYAVEPGGELRLVPRQTPTWKPPYVLAHANRYYYVSCGLVSAGFLVLAWRMREQTRQTNKVKGTPCKEMS
jgi:hypothetical protein